MFRRTPEALHGYSNPLGYLDSLDAGYFRVHRRSSHTHTHRKDENTVRHAMISRKVFFLCHFFYTSAAVLVVLTQEVLLVWRFPKARLLPRWKHTSIVVSHSDSPNWMMDAKSSPKGRLNFSLDLTVAHFDLLPVSLSLAHTLCLSFTHSVSVSLWAKQSSARASS